MKAFLQLYLEATRSVNMDNNFIIENGRRSASPLNHTYTFMSSGRALGPISGGAFAPWPMPFLWP